MRASNTGPHDRAMQELCPALSLGRSEQDWPIEMADSNRVDEFCQFLAAQSELSPYGRSLLFELILASLNDALEESKVTPASLARYADHLKRFSTEFPSETRAWINLPATPADPFPVAAWMRSVLGSETGDRQRGHH